MTQPTMVTSDGHLHVGRLSTTTWQAAVDHLGHQPPEGTDEDALVEWRAAGIIDEDLAVAPDWRRAIDAQHGAPAALTIVGRMGEVAFLTNLYLCPELGDAVAVTLRATADHTGKIDFIHPMAEVALAPSGRLWTLLRRVVPPLDAFRADPEADRGEPVPVAGDAAKLGTAETAEASVFAFGANAESGRSEEAIWYLSEDHLHRLSPATGDVLRVFDGDVAEGLVSLAERVLA